MSDAEGAQNIVGDEYITKKTGENKYEIQNVIRLSDINENPLHETLDAFAFYPVGIENNPYNITTDEYLSMTRKFTYFRMKKENGSLLINGNGEFCPCTIEVLYPTDPATANGQIYDRFYTINSKVTAGHKTLSGLGNLDSNNVSIHSTTSILSASKKPTNYKYLELIK